jgi:hypothetical protein
MKARRPQPQPSAPGHTSLCKQGVSWRQGSHAGSHPSERPSAGPDGSGQQPDANPSVRTGLNDPAGPCWCLRQKVAGMTAEVTATLPHAGVTMLIRASLASADKEEVRGSSPLRPTSRPWTRHPLSGDLAPARRAGQTSQCGQCRNQVTADRRLRWIRLPEEDAWRAGPRRSAWQRARCWWPHAQAQAPGRRGGGRPVQAPVARRP